MDDVATKGGIWPAAELGRFQSSRREVQAVPIPRSPECFVLAATPLRLLLLTWLLVASCQKKQNGATQEQGPNESVVPSENAATTGIGAGTLTSPTGCGKRTGDLDEM